MVCLVLLRVLPTEKVNDTNDDDTKKILLALLVLFATETRFYCSYVCRKILVCHDAYVESNESNDRPLAWREGAWKIRRK